MHDNEHIWFSEQMATYLAEGLEGEERARFEAHASECESCARELERARNDESRLATLFEDAKPQAGLEDRIIANLRTETTRSFRIHPWITRAAATAAAVAIVGTAGYFATEAVRPKYTSALNASNTQTEMALERAGSRATSADQRQIEQTTLAFANDAISPQLRTSPEAFPKELGLPGATPNDSMMALFPSRRSQDAASKFDEASAANSPNDSAQRENAGIDRQEFRYGYTLPEPKTETAQSTRERVDTGRDVASASADQFKPAEFGKAVDETRLGVQLGEKDADADKKLKDAAAPVTAGKPPQQSQPAGAEPAPPATHPANQRKIIRNGEIEFEVDSFDSSLATIAKVVLEEGGFVATTNSQKLDNGKVKGTVVVRVPPDHLDTLVTKLRALGDLKRQNLSAQDVSKQYNDLESELRAARAMEERLIEIIKSGKGEIKDLLAAEKELANWRGKIEKITGEINFYNNLISLSTLSIDLMERNISTAAATIEQEEINAGVEIEDVESARAAAIKSIDEAKGRIIESELKKLDGGQFAARIVAEVPTENSGAITDRLKQLGKVARLDVQRKQTTPGGTAPLPGARVETKPTRMIISLYNLANVAPRETTNLNLASDDVEATYRSILARIEKAGGRVVSSALNREKANQVSGTIHFEVKGSESGPVLLDVRGLGEVLRLAVTENPDTANVTTAKQGFVVQLFSTAQIAPRETITMQIAVADVSAVYQALVESAKSHGRVLSSQANEQDRQNVTGSLDLELPRSAREGFDTALASAGDVLMRNATRSSDTENTLDSKLRLQITLIGADRVPPRESTQIGLQSSKVDATVARIQSATTGAGGRVVESNLSRDGDGHSSARMLLDVPLGKAPQIIDQVKSFGEVRVEQSSKNAQVPEGSLSRARIEVAVASPQAIVGGDQGIWTSIREGLSTSAAGLMWSLQILVVGLCFVVPWALLLLGGFKLWKRVHRQGVPSSDGVL